MKALREIVFGLIGYLGVLSAAFADIHFVGTAGQTLKVRFNDASDTEVALTAGSGATAGLYTATDGAIETASLDAGTYVARILTSGNVDVGLVPEFHWSGSAELPPDVNVEQLGGEAQSATDLKDFVDAGYDPTTHVISASLSPAERTAIAAANKQLLLSTTVSSGTSTSQFTIAFTSSTASSDMLVNSMCIWRNFTNDPETRRVVSYVPSTGQVTVDPAFSTTPNASNAVDFFAVPMQLVDVKNKTDHLPNFDAGEAGGLVQLNHDGELEANIAGNVNGSVGNVAAGGITNGSFAAGAIDAAAIADGAIDASAIASGAIVKGTEATGWNDLSSAQVNAEVGAQLVAKGLDHLVTAAVGGGDVVNDSIVAKLAASNGQWTSFVNADDSLQAQRENIDSILDGAPTFAQAMDDHHYTSARADKLDNLDVPVSKAGPSLLVSTMISGAPASNTSFVLAEGPDEDDGLNGALVIVTHGAEKAVGLVKDYNGGTKTVTLVTDPGIFDFADGDTVDVIASGSPAALWLGGGP